MTHPATNRVSVHQRRPARKEKIWCDDADCSPSRLAGRLAARAGKTDERANRPEKDITEWLIGHYEEKCDLYRFDLV